MEFFGKKMRFGPATPEEKPLVDAIVALGEENRIRDLEGALKDEHIAYQQAERELLEKHHEIEALTGLKTRKLFEQKLEEELAIVRQDPTQEASVIMIDLDKFKEVNDTYGHSGGDEVLRSVGRLLNEQSKSGVATFGRTDAEREPTAARYGGEELIILLPRTSLAAAKEYAEKLRAGIEVLTFATYPNLEVTASLGVSSTALSADKTALLESADEALYRAKDLGRNKVITAT